ncbi:nucleoside diphosphate kinase [Fimicolochytrium jonesii]|uniref:nucleoside diphosphate kinase n=1 Tax=Fimicolochytrium jonesii TaxID=1396493 RepID=UPI0022FEAB02|nr:nucleoside diphosphate kinase [Fimicolochytrium jonesii]KAI8823476.1 nucleoside diphosphate kinase [Fimicolochytrium jonesii]
MASTTTAPEDDRYCFRVDWFDDQAALCRPFQLLFYPNDQTVEMYDVKQRRTFLKRTHIPLKLHDLYIGATVTVNSRQLLIQGYADEYTRKALEEQLERSLLVIKHSSFSQAGQILDEVLRKGFNICQMRMVQPSRRQCEEIVRFSGTKSGIDQARVLAVEVLKANAVGDLLRHFQTDGQDDIFVTKSHEAARQCARVIFDPSSQRPSDLQNSTLGLIRPHAVLSGQTGKIINDILQAGFVINNAELFRLQLADAEEFLEVYKGVIPEYHSMLTQLTSGPVIALEVAGKDDIVNIFRDFCGPTDPELGKQVRPQTLRAKYGIDKAQNAVHCTDLEEDGPLEVQYFFRILVS